MALQDLQKAAALDPARTDIPKLLERLQLEIREGHHAHASTDKVRPQSAV